MSHTICAEREDVAIEDSSLFDAVRLGALIRGARHREGYVDMSDLVLAVYRQTGMRWHEHSLYAVEQGKRLPNINMLVALMMTLDMKAEELG